MKHKSLIYFLKNKFTIETSATFLCIDHYSLNQIEPSANKDRRFYLQNKELLFYGNLVNAALMSSTFKVSTKEFVKHFLCYFVSNISTRHNEYIGIVVSTCQIGYFRNPTQCSPNSLMFIQRYGNAVSGSADGNTGITFSCLNSQSHRMGKIRIIATIQRISAKILIQKFFSIKPLLHKLLKFKTGMENVRIDDGAQNVNRYIVASFVSRWALYEASWQKYYYKDDTRAVKFYDLAVNAAEMVMNSGKYDIVTDFRTLFGSTDLTSNKDCILYRKYDATKSITHSIASSCNMFSPTDVGPNLDLIKSFICVDGKDWQTSSVTKANDFTLSNLVKTRDPRFEASFWSEPTPKSKSCYLYVTKFIPRSALNYLKDGTTPTAEFQSNKNVTGYPVMRYAEVLLNWIEAKAELATLGGSPIVQGDIDKSINKIRNRPLDSEAIAKGVQKTAPMDLSNLPNDPDRDTSVSPLIWEIRRERRMEFAFEYSRIVDLRRWKKLQYMPPKARCKS